MKNNFESKNSEGDRTAFVKNLLKEAIKNLVDEKDIARYEILSSKKSLQGDDKAFFDSFKKKIDDASVIVHSLSDFRTVLSFLGQSEDYVKDLIEHENAHANKAEQLGAKFGGYRLVFYKENGEIRFQPFADTDVPEDFEGGNKAKRKEAHRQILLAPQEYGNKLSPIDIDSLETLDEKYE